MIAANSTVSPRATDLPFLGMGCKWSLPATGGSSGGEAAGKAAAEIYVREYLRPIQLAGAWHIPTLQKIALSIADRIAAATTDDERASLRGQLVGFMSHLDSYLLWTSAWLDETPADRTPEALRAQLQAGLDFDQEAHDRELARRARSEAAQLGWERRRAKGGAR